MDNNVGMPLPVGTIFAKNASTVSELFDQLQMKMKK